MRLTFTDWNNCTDDSANSYVLDWTSEHDAISSGVPMWFYYEAVRQAIVERAQLQNYPMSIGYDYGTHSALYRISDYILVYYVPSKKMCRYYKTFNPDWSSNYSYHPMVGSVSEPGYFYYSYGTWRQNLPPYFNWNNSVAGQLQGSYYSGWAGAGELMSIVIDAVEHSPFEHGNIMYWHTLADMEKVVEKMYSDGVALQNTTTGYDRWTTYASYDGDNIADFAPPLDIDTVCPNRHTFQILGYKNRNLVQSNFDILLDLKTCVSALKTFVKFPQIGYGSLEMTWNGTYGVSMRGGESDSNLTEARTDYAAGSYEDGSSYYWDSWYTGAKVFCAPGGGSWNWTLVQRNMNYFYHNSQFARDIEIYINYHTSSSGLTMVGESIQDGKAELQSTETDVPAGLWESDSVRPSDASAAAPNADHTPSLASGEYWQWIGYPHIVFNMQNHFTFV